MRRALEAIRYLKPERWYLENPATGLLRTRGLLDHDDYVVVDYCRFAPWGYRTPTQIWGTVQGLVNVSCDSSQCPNMTLQRQGLEEPRWKHCVRPEGVVVPLREKYRIPERLVEYLAVW